MDYHAVLKKHGYTADDHKRTVYTHPETGFGVHLEGNKWKHKEHDADGGGHLGNGLSSDSLDKHLTGMHNSQHSERKADQDDPRIQRAQYLREHPSNQFAHGSYHPPAGHGGTETTNAFHDLVAKHGGSSDSRGGFSIPHGQVEEFHKAALTKGHNHGTHYTLGSSQSSQYSEQADVNAGPLVTPDVPMHIGPPIQLREEVAKQYAEEEAGQHHVFMQSSQLGNKTGDDYHPRHGRYLSSHDSEEEAKSRATRMNKSLSPGDRVYYKTKFHVQHDSKLGKWKVPVKKASQHAEEDEGHGDADDGSPGNVQLSKHHQALVKKGYKFASIGNNGWTAHYEHNSGKKARIEWQNSSDLHGTLHHSR